MYNINDKLCLHKQYSDAYEDKVNYIKMRYRGNGEIRCPCCLNELRVCSSSAWIPTHMFYCRECPYIYEVTTSHLVDALDMLANDFYFGCSNKDCPGHNRVIENFVLKSTSIDIALAN